MKCQPDCLKKTKKTTKKKQQQQQQKNKTKKIKMSSAAILEEVGNRTAELKYIVAVQAVMAMGRHIYSPAAFFSLEHEVWPVM